MVVAAGGGAIHPGVRASRHVLVEIHCSREKELPSSLPLRICVCILGTVLEKEKPSLLTERISRAQRIPIVEAAIWSAHRSRDSRSLAWPQEYTATQSCR